MFLTNRSHVVKNGGRNGIHCCRQVPILYECVDNILMVILVTRIYFILTITWSLAYECGQQRNRWDKKCRQIDDDFDGHSDAAVRRGAHRPIKHIQGFTRSHWMPPLGECLHHIAAAADMVDNFGRKHKTLKKIFLASQPTVDRSQNQWGLWDPKRTLYSPRWCDELRENVKHQDRSWRAPKHF